MTISSKFNIEPLDVNNYPTWRTRMKAFLIHEGLWYTIAPPATVVATTGTSTRTATKADAEAEAKATEDTEKALSLIILNVKDHHLPILARYNTAADAWNALESIFSAKTVSRAVDLVKQLAAIKKLPSEDMTMYISRVKGLCAEIEATGEEVKPSMAVVYALAGLPREFDNIVTFISSSDAVWDLDKLLPKLVGAENRLQAEEPYNEENAHALVIHSRMKPHSDKECYYCHKKGHVQANCFKRKRDQGNGAVIPIAI